MLNAKIILRKYENFVRLLVEYYIVEILQMINTFNMYIFFKKI